MSVGRRKHVGWEVRCDGRGCQQTTALQAPSRVWLRDSDRAIEAARRLGWLSVTIDWETFWVCPLHQTYDLRIGRWIVIRSQLPRRANARHAS